MKETVFTRMELIIIFSIAALIIGMHVGTSLASDNISSDFTVSVGMKDYKCEEVK